MAFSAPIFTKMEFPQQPKEEIFYPELIKISFTPLRRVLLQLTQFSRN
jgi:hypothetical protein